MDPRTANHKNTMSAGKRGLYTQHMMLGPVFKGELHSHSYIPQCWQKHVICEHNPRDSPEEIPAQWVN